MFIIMTWLMIGLLTVVAFTWGNWYSGHDTQIKDIPIMILLVIGGIFSACLIIFIGISAGLEHLTKNKTVIIKGRNNEGR